VAAEKGGPLQHSHSLGRLRGYNILPLPLGLATAERFVGEGMPADENITPRQRVRRRSQIAHAENTSG
jgi:hypothetical protein